MTIWKIFWMVSFASMVIISYGIDDNFYLELFILPAVITVYLALALGIVLPLCLAPIQMARGIENRQISQLLYGAGIFALIEYSLLSWNPWIFIGVSVFNWVVIILTIYYPEELTKKLASVARGALM